MIGKKIRAIREKMELTLDQAAKKLGTSAQYLGHIERGETVVSEEMATKLVRKFGIPKAAIAGRESQNRKARSLMEKYRRKSAKPKRGAKNARKSAA